MSEARFTLRGARANSNLGLRESAVKLGISEDTLRSYENGKTFPNIITVKKMEELYQVPYHQLIFLPDNIS